MGPVKTRGKVISAVRGVSVKIFISSRDSHRMSTYSVQIHKLYEVSLIQWIALSRKKQEPVVSNFKLHYTEHEFPLPKVNSSLCPATSFAPCNGRNCAIIMNILVNLKS